MSDLRGVIRTAFVLGSINAGSRSNGSMATIFTRIIAGQIPGNFIFRGEHWCSLLDIRPSSAGHALLIPVVEGGHLAELPSATLADMGEHLARLTTTIKQVTGCPAVNVLLNDGPVAGQEVPHVHWHVVPRWPNDQLGYRFIPQTGNGLTELAERLAAAWIESA